MWAFRDLDLNGPWCWSALDAASILDVHRRLANYESMAWKEILNGTGSHEIEPWEIGKDGQDRLREMGLDVDGLVSLRIDGPGRIWGYREGAVLRILWWDPEHQVYPVGKKHS